MANNNHTADGVAGSLPRPEVTPIHKGPAHTVLQGASAGAAFMPEHDCTHEAVVVGVEGRVEIALTDAGERHAVDAGECYIIHPKVQHTLSSPGAFRLFLTMPAAAEIRFKE